MMENLDIESFLASSDARMQEILKVSDQEYLDIGEIPDDYRLTYQNGYYVDCTALFIDIRGSTKLAEKHTRPVLGKIYRAYISECVALLNQDESCRKLIIQGDCVGAISQQTNKEAINEAFRRAAQLNSLITHLNWRLRQRDYPELDCGIGFAAGRALMIKAGHKGSGIKDVVWMGNVVNDAAKLCHQGARGDRKAIQISTFVYSKLSEENQSKTNPVYAPQFLRFNEVVNYETSDKDISMEGWSQTLQTRVRDLANRFNSPASSKTSFLSFLGLDD